MVAVLLIFDRVKSVALWSANIRKLAKNHKGYAARTFEHCEIQEATYASALLVPGVIIHSVVRAADMV